MFIHYHQKAYIIIWLDAKRWQCWGVCHSGINFFSSKWPTLLKTQLLCTLCIEETQKMKWNSLEKRCLTSVVSKLHTHQNMAIRKLTGGWFVCSWPCYNQKTQASTIKYIASYSLNNTYNSPHSNSSENSSDLEKYLIQHQRSGH